MVLFCQENMNRWYWPILFLATATIVLIAASCSEAACMKDAHAVWAAHPGSHPTYSGTGDHKCWYAAGTRKEVARSAKRETVDRKIVARTMRVARPDRIHNVMELWIVDVQALTVWSNINLAEQALWWIDLETHYRPFCGTLASPGRTCAVPTAEIRTFLFARAYSDARLRDN
jgi:hypothetical protein